jgi:hypothetical protein
MTRSQRIFVGLLAAYAASITLYASQWKAESWVYRHYFDATIARSPYYRPGGRPLLTIAKDFGWERTWMESFVLHVADLRGPILVPAVAAFFLLGLCAGLLGKPSPSKLDKD